MRETNLLKTSSICVIRFIVINTTVDKNKNRFKQAGPKAINLRVKYHHSEAEADRFFFALTSKT